MFGLKGNAGAPPRHLIAGAIDRELGAMPDGASKLPEGTDMSAMNDAPMSVRGVLGNAGSVMGAAKGALAGGSGGGKSAAIARRAVGAGLPMKGLESAGMGAPPEAAGELPSQFVDIIAMLQQDPNLMRLFQSKLGG